MYLPDLIVRSRRVVTRDGVRPAALHIRGGRIIGVLDFENRPDGCPVDDAGDLVVMPGVVDTHVHVNASTAEDADAFGQTTRAAASGGVTTIIDAGSVGQPTATVSMLEQKRRAAEGRSAVDVGFCGGIVPGNSGEIGLLAAEGVFAFACTLGVAAIEGAAVVNETDLRTAMPRLARIGATLTVHGELPGPIERAVNSQRASMGLLDRATWSFRGSREYLRFLETHPKAAETDAVVQLLELCREYGTKTHIVSLSSADALTPIFRARAVRMPVTVETCPHYLFFVAEEVPAGATAFKCAPPIRERANRELLWGALAGGLIQMVASDHSPPRTGFPGRQARDFSGACGSIASVQLSLPAVWTIASARGHTVDELAAWMCRGPARIAGLERKGEIDVGYDADLLIWDPDTEFSVDAATLVGPPASNPYAGRSLRGIVARVYLRGNVIHQRGRPIERAMGRLLVKRGMSSPSFVKSDRA
jgi:allantoinase